MSKAATPQKTATLTERLAFLFLGEKALSSVPGSDRSWFTVIKESFAGAWQQNVEISQDTALTFHAVFACVTLISSDISKLRIVHEKRNAKTGVWEEVKKSRLTDLLASPNGYQNLQQFIENWLISKATRGNTYILLGKTTKNNVRTMYVMDPDRTTVLVSDSGQVFYRFMADDLAGLKAGQQYTVPASEVIHDRYNCLFHPLVGLPPLYACMLAASQGIKMQTNSAKFYANMSRPSGMISAPGAIGDETAKRMKDAFETNYSADNIGKLAIAGDGLKFEPFTVSAKDSQLVEQLGLSSDIVCSTFHVPKYMVMGQAPTYNNIDALGQQYYSQCLQAYIEAIEGCLAVGLGLPSDERLTFDIAQLIRMDSETQAKVLTELVKGKLYTPNEGRAVMNKKPLDGGDDIYLQQQDFPMSTLSKRDLPKETSPTPPASSPPTPSPAGGGEADPAASKELLQLLDSINREVNPDEAQ